MTVVSAPGKLMLAGEYAILEGHVGLVAAVSRRARAALGPLHRGSTPGSDGWREIAPGRPEALLARTLAEQAFGAAEGTMFVDVSALEDGGKKLGLGSSAASAVAVAGAVAAARGAALDPGALTRIAFEAHRAVAPDGSGADVAAAAFGGVLAVTKSAEGPEITPLVPPLAGASRVVWTGHPARTSDLVRHVRALRGARPATYRERILEIASASDDFLRAARGSDAPALVEATRAHHVAMRALGDAAACPIVDEGIARAATLAETCGGAAKPSGAGGGDVAIAFFASEDNAERFEKACLSAGLTLLSLSLGAPGVLIEATEGRNRHA